MDYLGFSLIFWIEVQEEMIRFAVLLRKEKDVSLCKYNIFHYKCIDM